MRNTALICRNCIYRYLDERGNYKCEKSGKRIYWNRKDCPDYAKNESEVEND